MKRCSRCKEELPYSMFGKNRSKNDGYNIYCKPCHCQINKEWRLLNRDKARESSQQWIEKNKERHLAGHAIRIHRWREKNPAQYKVNIIAQNAFRDGKMKRPTSCIINNSRCTDVIEAHHMDYNKPMEVVGLCSAHHRAWHRVFIPEGK